MESAVKYSPVLLTVDHEQVDATSLRYVMYSSDGTLDEVAGFGLGNRDNQHRILIKRISSA